MKVTLNFGDYKVIIIIIIIIIIILLLLLLLLLLFSRFRSYYPRHNRKRFLKVTSYQTLLISTSAVKD